MDKRNIFKKRILSTNIPKTINTAHKIVFLFKISSTSIKNPNNRKNNDLIKKTISIVSSLNLRTSLLKMIG